METPKLKAPAGACDTHMHIYEDRFAPAPTAAFKSPHAPVSAYREVQQQLGLERAVVVQPSGYGFDNSCTLEAVAAMGASARCIVVVKPAAGDAELAQLTRAGARGLRYHMFPGGVLGWDTLEAMAARVAAYGWHIQLQLDGRDLAQYETLLRCLWASNWPHPNQNPQPSSATMLDLLLEWADDEATRRKILVDNPARLYGF